jgi:membrane-associated phospholipid phosphatase
MNMKTISLSLAALILLVVVGCDKTIDVTQPGEYIPSANDELATAWAPFLADTNALVVPAPPADVTAELATVKAAVASRTSEQNAAIAYWSSGALMRWNEIACELVAKYNVAPYAERNADGTFTGKFISDPNKPFTNPPYASRLYALLSVSNYDALIRAWQVKYKYNRAAPYTLDPSISPAVAKSTLPSYPSEDAVISASARDLLTFMFPLEKDYLAQKAKESMDVRVWAGANLPSDIAAGDSLGHAVAQLAIAYAKTDGMSKANDQARWKAKEATITTTYPHWASQETPSRPPMLPFFGEVKMWNVPNVEAVRPGPPPEFGSAQWNKDMEEMRDLTKNRTREQVRIANYWEDGGGTYCPPGHWNRIACDDIRAAKFSTIRAARVLAYMNSAEHDAAVSCWDTKYTYVTPRPRQVDPSITMSAGLPNFPGYTSGHSNYSAAAATVLSHFFPTKAASYAAMAKEAADSRVYSRIHVRTDCEVGVTQGNAIGAYAVQRAMKERE